MVVLKAGLMADCWVQKMVVKRVGLRAVKRAVSWVIQKAS
jgi:hypothetical protein